MHSDCLRHLAIVKKQVVAILAIAPKIHLSFDLWTSPNYKAMLAVTGFYTEDDYKARTILLGVP